MNIWVLDYIDADGEGQEYFRTFSSIEKMEEFLIETLDFKLTRASQQDQCPRFGV